MIHGYLGGRTLFTKAVGLSLSVASCLSLGGSSTGNCYRDFPRFMANDTNIYPQLTMQLTGKEGPLVRIASCVGNIVSRYFQKYETNEGG